MPTATQKNAKLRSGAQGQTGSAPAGSPTGTELVLNGLVRGGTLPQVTGRGRKATPLDSETVSNLAATLAGEGVAHFTGNPNEVTNFKLAVNKKWAAIQPANSDGQPVKVEFRTIRGRMPANGQPGSDQVTIAYAAHYAEPKGE